ncbi:hypothetical protein BGX26_006570 [Mortierella sp. AD094]|nr:hypothetical protein BGX26_006570 [Mortierella sp. AD094]
MSEAPNDSSSTFSKLRARITGASQPPSQGKGPPAQMGSVMNYMRPLDLNPSDNTYPVPYQHAAADHYRTLPTPQSPQSAQPDYMRTVDPYSYPTEPQIYIPPVNTYQSQAPVNHLRTLVEPTPDFDNSFPTYPSPPPLPPSRISYPLINSTASEPSLEQKAPDPMRLLVSEDDVYTQVGILSMSPNPIKDDIIVVPLEEKFKSSMREDPLLLLPPPEKDYGILREVADEADIDDRKPQPQPVGMVEQNPFIVLHTTPNYPNVPYVPCVPTNILIPQNEYASVPSNPYQPLDVNNNSEENSFNARTVPEIGSGNAEK